MENPQQEKLWQTEFLAINQNSNELQVFISQHYIKASNYLEALEELKNTGLEHLRLTGKWFIDEKEISRFTEFNSILDRCQHEYVEFSYDQLHDFLSLGEKEDIIEVLELFTRDERYNKFLDMIKGYLKHKYNYE